MAPQSPTIAIWELGLRLRERRYLLGLTATEAGRLARCTQAHVSEIERGRTRATKDKLTRLIKSYEFDSDESAELWNLHDHGAQRGWWNRYTGIFSNELLRFFGYEYGAESVRTYSGGLIPGLVQTEDYIRAVIRGAAPNLRLSEEELRVTARKTRQRRLVEDDPLHLTAVISEATLRQCVGGVAVLRGQLEHLARLVAEQPENLTVRVIPFSAGGFDALDGSSFHLVGFTSPRLPTLAWQETITSTSLIDHTMTVREYTLAYHQAEERALDREESLRLIRDTAKELS
ncbi:DUF5753 domain-containing protein [Actinoalloteichus hymeniacidonis]|uniref:DNA binding protein with helix-turn-helix domain n=1 Tax=Actinoalloteichus hymeniacidonis TaxID=340345 RepID=A0AAC9HUR2_9PSEU|nr:DUF5753 domain-containing protein [Actinoalloteichus hymeniacidonis]AOS65331.1 DNA binding protein with helix-turn-helix domain [Actinoalloteichus hymeniacidonis]MBB5906583.1 transcriptional regulator with XRE-family HTH domain [Actinoalloteichus hymeniacidonis]